MRRLSSVLLLCGLVLCCLVNAQKSQPPASSGAGDQPIFISDTRLVDLPVGRLLVLDQNVPHDVEALEESAFLLAIALPDRATG